MRFLFLSTLFFFCILCEMNGQECMNISVSIQGPNTPSIGTCNDWKSYIPGYTAGDPILSHHPVHTIRLSVSIIENGNGDPWGNWTNDHSTDLDRVKTIFNNWVQRLMERNDYASAITVLDSIPILFTLSKEENREHDNYSSLIYFLDVLQKDGRTIMQLDSTEIMALKDIASASDKVSGTLADNILCFGYHICKQYAFALPEDESNQRKASPKKKKEKPGVNYLVHVSPNPTKSSAFFSFDFSNEKDQVQLIITDVSGRIIEDILLNTKKGLWTWDAANFENGIYMYEFRSTAKSLFKGKIIVNH